MRRRLGAAGRPELVARADTALLVVGVLVVQLLPTQFLNDGMIRYDSLRRLMEGHGLVGARFAVWGYAGAVPLYLVGRAVGHPALFTAHYNGVLVAALVVGLAVVLADVLSGPVLRTFLLLVVGASMFPAHVEQFYGEVFTAALAAVGLALVVLRPRWSGWALVVLAVANTPATVPALVLVVVYRIATTRSMRWVVAVAVCGLLVVTDARWRGANVLTGAYADDHGPKTVLPYSGLVGFSYPVVLGLANVMLSFGRGLLFFVPGLWVSTCRAVRLRLGPRASQVLVVWLVFLGGLIVVYARWWGWNGGVIFYGPRFFLFACLPGSLALAALLARPPARAWAKGVVLALLGLAIFVSVDGGALQTTPALRLCIANDNALQFLCWNTPEFSPLWRPFVDPLHLGAGQVAFVAWEAVLAVRLAAPLVAALARQVRWRPGLQLRQLRRLHW